MVDSPSIILPTISASFISIRDGHRKGALKKAITRGEKSGEAEGIVVSQEVPGGSATGMKYASGEVVAASV